jgi:hypothetical protein
MKCNKKFLTVLYSFFFLGTFNNVVKADDDSEMKHIIGVGVKYNAFNIQTGVEANLRKIAGIGDSNDEEKKQKYVGEGYNFGVEGMVNYDLYFNDLIALGVILKGGYNKIGSYKFDDGKQSSGSEGGNNNNNKEDNKKKCSISGGNLDILIGPKFNFLSEGLSFSDGEQEGLRFAMAVYGGIGFNFGSPETGEESKLKDKIEGSMLTVPAIVDIECVLGFGLKFNGGCEFKFISPVKNKEEKKNDQGNNDQNNNKKDLDLSMGIRPYIGVGYDLGAVING